MVVADFDRYAPKWAYGIGDWFFNTVQARRECHARTYSDWGWDVGSSLHTPTKKQTMVWKSSDEPAPKKFKAVKSAKKVMCTVFWDFKGVIHEEYFESIKTDKTITAAHYCDTLLRLCMAIKRKWPGLLSHSVILLHDNVRPHSATIMCLLLEDFKWDVFRHSPYSPHLASSNYHLFLLLKAALGGLHFQSNTEVVAWCRIFFRN